MSKKPLKKTPTKRKAPTNKPRKKPGLTVQQERFVELLVVEGKRQTEAARLAGYSEKSAGRMANALIQNPLIAEAIKQKREKLSMRSLANRDRWIEELARVAFCDVAGLFREDGTIKQISEMSEDSRRVLAGMDVAEITAGETVIGQTKKIRLLDKLEALKTLGKAEGWIIERQDVNLTSNLASRLESARKRQGGDK